MTLLTDAAKPEQEDADEAARQRLAHQALGELEPEHRDQLNQLSKVDSTVAKHLEKGHLRLLAKYLGKSPKTHALAFAIELIIPNGLSA